MTTYFHNFYDNTHILKSMKFLKFNIHLYLNCHVFFQIDFCLGCIIILTNNSFFLRKVVSSLLLPIVKSCKKLVYIYKYKYL